MDTALKDILVQGIEKLGLNAQELIPPLQQYFNEILFWNKQLGLVKANEREIVVKHFLDSAAAFSFFENIMETYTKVDVADLGSGAGLPGVILALIFRDRPGFQMHLVEKRHRPCVFLRNLLPMLGLSTLVHIHQQGVETLNIKFDIVTSRAFNKITAAQYQLQIGLLRPGGKIVAYKGRRETIIQEFGDRFPADGKIIPLSVPFLNGERHLVVLNGH